MSPLENQIFSRDAGKTSSLVSADPGERERKGREGGREREREEGEEGKRETVVLVKVVNCSSTSINVMTIRKNLMLFSCIKLDHALYSINYSTHIIIYYKHIPYKLTSVTSVFAS